MCLYRNYILYIYFLLNLLKNNEMRIGNVDKGQ